MKGKLTNADALTIVIDGASIHNAVINVIVCTPEPFFYTSIDTGKETKTAAYLVSLIQPIIEELGPQRLTAVVTDNASNMDSFRSQLKAHYPHLITYGCMAHILNLLLKDIIGNNLISSSNVITRAQLIVNEITRSSKKKAWFKSKMLAHSKDTGSKAFSLKSFSITR